MSAGRTRVKICGITRFEDAANAISAGADALGFVFYPKSPRYIAPQEARKIIQKLPAFVQTVGLFVNETVENLVSAVTDSGVQLLQFHGNEPAKWCEEQAKKLSRPYIKALGVENPDGLLTTILEYINCQATAVLLDAYDPTLYGGTGKIFDWNQWPRIDFPLILAGGLTPENVSDAIRMTDPYAVDVSGGVEAVDPISHQTRKGIKDNKKIQAFIQAVQETDFESAHRSKN